MALLGLSQVLQDGRCSFRGGLDGWDSLGRDLGHWDVTGVDMALGALKKEGSRPRGHEYNMASETLHGENCSGETPALSVSGPACPAGMEYKECVSPCPRTCQSLHINEVCQEQCVDGCSCPGNKLSTLFTHPRPCQSPWLGEAR